MKKGLLIALVCLLVLSVSACTGSMGDVNDKEVKTDPASTEAETVSSEEASATSNQEQKDEDSQDITIERQVIYDGNGVVVTVTGLSEDGWFGPAVKVLIENNSDRNIEVQSRNSSVNGLMVDTMFSASVAAGKKANDDITFSSSTLDISGISTMKEIEFYLHVFDSETWDSLFDTEMITLVTSADPTFVQEYDDSGHVAYDEGGIKVVAKKLNSSDSFWGSDLYLYIENNTDQNIVIQTRDVSINGFMVDPIFSCDITAGKKAFDSITFFESDLTENAVTDIQELELKFHIFNMESWDTIKDTPVISIEF